MAQLTGGGGRQDGLGRSGRLVGSAGDLPPGPTGAPERGRHRVGHLKARLACWGRPPNQSLAVGLG